MTTKIARPGGGDRSDMFVPSYFHNPSFRPAAVPGEESAAMFCVAAYLPCKTRAATALSQDMEVT